MNKEQERDFLIDRITFLRTKKFVGVGEAIKQAKKEVLIMKLDEAQTIEDIKEILGIIINE